MKGILQVIEYLDPIGKEIVHRVPEGGSGEMMPGSQCIVRENQIAVFFRDGRALDLLGPGRHMLTPLNIPLLANYLKDPYGSRNPFRAEVIFVSMKDYLDLRWAAPKPIPYRDAEFGMVRLEPQGHFSFQVGRPQPFVNQIVGAQGLYSTQDIIRYLQNIVAGRITDVLGELKVSVRNLAAKYDDLGAELRARASVDFEALGLLLKAVSITALNLPPEIKKATAAPTDAGIPVGGDLVDGFIQLKQRVAQQLTLSDGDKQDAVAALDALLTQLTSPTATMADVKAARGALTTRFPWLEAPIKNLLSTPTALQFLGHIAARSL
jgi:membrane protease subunit (stomatin/prohibitin family)